MFEKLVSIISEQLSIDAAEIHEDSSFKDDLEADSLDLYELVMALEEAYDVEFPSDDLEKLLTVRDIMDYLSAKGIDL
ncbi:MAG: acyl carrier protein [Lachnospiraceae bacterium]|nr:acyl carrier protein [Lachnospiraceae bacterium]